jgi:dihydroxyacetone kinase
LALQAEGSESIPYTPAHHFFVLLSCSAGKHGRLTLDSEPMFSGFVGPSFLSCAVSGSIFASPTSAQIFEAIKLCQPAPSPQCPGTLIVCGNYTGDILNAGLAITRAQAAGYKVKFVPVGDDIAVGRKKGGKVGRRGLSGHLVALKIACALADTGESLERVSEAMEYVAQNLGTIGVAFDR